MHLLFMDLIGVALFFELVLSKAGTRQPGSLHPVLLLFHFKAIKSICSGVRGWGEITLAAGDGRLVL
jgi:hypothetical protein